MSSNDSRGMPAGDLMPDSEPAIPTPDVPDAPTVDLHNEWHTALAARRSLVEQFKPVALALEPREVTPYLIEGHLPTKALVALYGRPGAHKTNYALEMAFSIASGQEHLVTEPPAMRGGLGVNQMPVLWCDVDSGRDVLLERFEAFAKGRKIDLRGLPFYFVSFPDPPINAARGLADLIVAIQCFGAGLVVLDNLLRIAGVPDENSPLMDTAMAALRGAVEKTRATVLFIHHPAKNRIAGDMVDGDDLRGHSSILAAVDLALRVQRDNDTVTIKPTKVRRSMPATCSARYYFTHRADGVTLDECRFFSCESPASKMKQEEKGRRLQAIHDALADSEMSFNKLFDVVKGDRAQLKSDLSELRLAGKIDVRDGPNNSQLHSIKNWVVEGGSE